MANAEAAPEYRSTSRSWPLIVGLLVAAGVACLGWPPAYFHSWTQLLGAAVQRVLFVSLACVAAASVLCRIVLRSNRIEADRLVVHLSVAALWLAPLAVFIRENSVWTVVITAVFVVAGTRSFLTSQNDFDWNGPSESRIAFLRPDGYASAFNGTLLSAAAAFSVQAGVLLAFDGRAFLAVLLVGAGFSAWTWASVCYGTSDDPQELFKKPFPPRRMLALALAISFTVVGLLPYLRGAGGFSHTSGKYPWHPAFAAPSLRPSRVNPSEESASEPSEGNAGIVLWPPKQLVTKLVMPPPERESFSLTNFHNADPLVIPFNGVYWFFKAPDLQPPKASRQAHASPEMVEIRSVDRRPLSIEAHDHLGQLIDLNCCRSIQVAIRNADRYPETVSLELVLVNTSLPDKPSQSLGQMMVKSSRPWKLYDKPFVTSETLNFTIPANRLLRRFDEVRVVFRLDRARADAAAKIAIDHLVLVPRGL